MNYYAGLDISDATTNICIIDNLGTIIHELVVQTKPEDIVSALSSYDIPIEKIGMETGAKSNWLYRAISSHFNIVCYDSRKMAPFISVRGNKTDKNDAQVIAKITRVDALSDVLCSGMEVHVKDPENQEILTMIRARESSLGRLNATYNQVRAIYKTHGVSIPTATAECFTKLVFETKNQLPKLVKITVEELISTYDQAYRSIQRMTKIIDDLAMKNKNAQLLMSIPEIGSITALCFAACIDDPTRFNDAKSAGSYFGLTPLDYSSGEKQHKGSTSKRGDATTRNLLVGTARRIMQPKAKTNALKKRGQKKEKTLGKNKAAVALARHLAVIMLAMLMQQTTYIEYSVVSKKGVSITTEELIHLTGLSQKLGCIESKSIQNLKKLAKVAT